MNIYKASIMCVSLFLSPGLVSQAQEKQQKQAFEKSIQKLVSQAEQLGYNLSDKFSHIDTEKIIAHAERMAEISEQQAIKITDKLQNISWESSTSASQYQQTLEADANSVEQSKTIQKVYIISKNTPLQIDNRYGTVDVKTWEKNEIKVDIIVRAVEADGSKAQEIINSVDIEETKSAALISLKTQINKGKSSWWNNVISSKNRGVQINYTIYLPKSNTLTVHNAYGAVVLPDFSGSTELDVSYGSLTTGRLSGSRIIIRSSYGSAKIASVKDAALDFKYGSMSLGEANNIELNIGYCGGSKIDKLIHSGDISIKYSGGFKIGLDKSISRLNLDAAYSASNISIDPAANFAYDVNVGYGSFNPGKAIITKEEPDPDSRGPKLHKSYSGYFGKSSANKVTIDSKYGSIKFD